MLLKGEPSLKGQIVRFGAAPTVAERYIIAPHFYYGGIDDLPHSIAAPRPAPSVRRLVRLLVADERVKRNIKLLPVALKKLGFVKLGG